MSQTLRGTRQPEERALLLRERLEIGQKGRSLVVAGGVAVLYFVLDFSPDAFAPTMNRFELGLAGLLSGFGLPSPFLWRLC